MRAYRRDETWVWRDLKRERAKERHARGCRVRNRATPSAMHGDNHTTLPIGKQNRNTIGRSNSARDARNFGRCDVANAFHHLFSVLFSIENGNVSPMDLAEEVQLGHGDTESHRTTTNVLRHGFLQITRGNRRYVERVEGAFAYTAKPGEKGVTKTLALKKEGSKPKLRIFWR